MVWIVRRCVNGDPTTECRRTQETYLSSAIHEVRLRPNWCARGRFAQGWQFGLHRRRRRSRSRVWSLSQNNGDLSIFALTKQKQRDFFADRVGPNRLGKSFGGRHGHTVDCDNHVTHGFIARQKFRFGRRTIRMNALHANAFGYIANFRRALNAEPCGRRNSRCRNGFEKRTHGIDWNAKRDRRARSTFIRSTTTHEKRNDTTIFVDDRAAKVERRNT